MPSYTDTKLSCTCPEGSFSTNPGLSSRLGRQFENLPSFALIKQTQADIRDEMELNQIFCFGFVRRCVRLRLPRI